MFKVCAVQNSNPVSIPGKVKLFICPSNPAHFLSPHTTFCSILTALSHYTGTHVTVSTQHCLQAFIHKFRRHIRQFTKATIRFVMTVCLSVCPSFYPHGRTGFIKGGYFNEFCYLRFFEILSRKLQFKLKCDIKS